MGRFKKPLRHFSIQPRSMGKLYHFAPHDVVMGNKMNAMINYSIEEDKIAINNQLDYVLLVSFHTQRRRLILKSFQFIVEYLMAAANVCIFGG